MLSNHSIRRLGLKLLMAIFAISLTTTSAFALVPYDLITGQFADGPPPTQWAVVKPIPNWNGTIILDLDGNAVRGSLSATVKWLLDHGYAYGGTTRSPVAYNFPQAVENLVTVRTLFSAQYEVPSRTIAWGGSRGGFVGRLCMELRPDIFDGAIVMAGGGGGEIAVLNSKLDSLFVLKTLVNPSSPLQIVGVPNNPTATTAENNALIDLVNLANSTPEGRARLALAAAVEQFAPWTVSSTDEPAPNDYDAQYAQLVTTLNPIIGMNYVFANPIVVRAPIEQLAGGVVSWNHGVNYTELLARSGRADFVKAMYQEAGLDLKADLRTLEKAPRTAADPEAVAIAEKFMSYTGEIFGPVINIDNIGDPVDPPSMKLAYRHTVNRAGNSKLFRLAWVHRPAHGGQSDLERITAFVTLINRLDTGKWGDTSAAGMNVLAQQVSAEWPSFPILVPLFMENNGVSKLLRPWDVSDWDSYQPCTGYQPGKAFNSCR